MPPPEVPKEGGKRPRKIPPKKTVVEPAPSHDGAPCFTAYTVDCYENSRPQFVLRIYDTTPAAGNPDRIRELALKIHKGTEVERCLGPYDTEGDRIEVVGLPLPQDTADEQRAEVCMAHHMAEVSARCQHRPDFYLPATFDNMGWWRAVVVLDRLEEGWEGAALYRPEPENGLRSEHGMVPPGQIKTYPHGRFILVRWDLTEWARQENQEEPLPEVDLTPYAIWELGRCLRGFREYMGMFRCFVQDGHLERELRGEAHDK
jgi:hypothetical protein